MEVKQEGAWQCGAGHMFRYEPPPAWPPWCIREDCEAGNFRWIIKDEVTGRDWLPEGDEWTLDPIQYGPPCPNCGHARTCEDCKAEDAYYAHMAERVERLGPELAMLPDFMECYDCGRQHLMVMKDAWGFKYVLRRPVGLGPIANDRQDPTQTYRLECGHGAM